MSFRALSAWLIALTLFVSLAAQAAESPTNTVITTAGPLITDASGNTFAISAGAQVVINATVDAATSNVVELAYVNHTVWQLNNSGNWYNYLGTPGSYGGPTTQSPLSSGTGKTSPPTPLQGTVTPNAWQSFDVTYPGITLACGKPFHFILAQPPQYNASLYKYPLYIWLHPDHSGDSWYLGDNNPLKQSGNEAGSYNTQAWQTKYPAFYAAPSADQTNGNGSAGSCTTQADSAIKNWGGWFSTGVTGSGTVYSGDTGPNTFAILAMVNDLEARYSIDPARIYINGFSLGGIYTDYACYHYNAYTGDKGKIFAACAGSAGVDQADAPVTTAKATAMQNVPQWMFSGTSDSASPPGSWNSPLCTALGGTPANLTAITSATANRCGASQMRYTLCPTCGHQDTDASGNPVWANQTINDFLFAQVAPTAPTGTGKFRVSGGKIIGPNGAAFKGVGINIGDFRSGLDMASAVTNFTTGAPLTTLFPGINFVRIALYGGGSASSQTAYPAVTSYDAFVNTMTALGIVVEFEHHVGTTGSTAGGGQGVVPGLSDSWLIAESNNYANLAAHFKDNPYVWFGTNNEPPSATGLSQWQQATYNAIRNAGNSNPVMLEVWGSRPPGYGGTTMQAGMVQSIYSAMTNVIWDPHQYGFINNNNTDQTTNNNTSRDIIAAAQTITSADGTVPVMIAEYGPSTTGSSLDANGTQNVTAVLQSGVGSAVWHWGQQDCCNNLNSGSSLTALGVQVAAAIKANASAAPSEVISVNAVSTVAAGAAFTVSGSVSGVSTAPSLQYSDNGGSWAALPSGANVTATGFSFSHPGMTSNPAATVAVRDANNTAISATGPPFIVRGQESANNTVANAVAGGVSAIITDANGNSFQILADATIQINGGAITTVSSNVTELAYVNHVLWQENTSLNWYSYTGNGGWSAATTTSPITAAPAEALAVGSIQQQVAGVAFTVTGTVSNVSSAPALQYQDNAGAWQAFPAAATVSATAFSFPHPAMVAGVANTVSVRDAATTTILASSNSFTVTASASESLSVNAVGSQIAGAAFTVSGTIANAPGASSTSTSFVNNPGQDGSYWKQPFQNSASWITSGNLITALRGGTPSINLKGNFSVPWVQGGPSDPLVTVTDGTKTIHVHMPLGTIIETPTSAFDQSIGGADSTQPYLVWSISGASMNTAGVQATGTTITGTYGMSVQDGAGLMMVDAVTGAPGSNNSIGGLQDYELSQIQADPNYVIPHMLTVTFDPSSQASQGGPVWPLKVLDTSPSPASYLGPIPQGVTIGIPASTPRPPGKTRGYYALWDQLQQQGMLNYNFGGTGGSNFFIYDQSGAYASLIADIQAAWVDIGHNYIAILNYDSATAGSQYSLATTKGAVPGSFNAFPAPPPLGLSSTNGVNVAPSTFGAWYPNTSYTATPTNPGVTGSGIPSLEYQDGTGAWNPLPSGATVTATTFSFLHAGMAATSSGKISVRDAAHTTVVAASNVFAVNTSASEAITVNPIASQTSGTPFTVSGSAVNTGATLGLQYQDNAGAWNALPSGSTITVTPGASGGGTPSFADYFTTLDISDLGGAPTGGATVILATTAGASLKDTAGNTWTIVSGQALENGVSPVFSANVTELALVNGVIWQENASAQWYSFVQTGTNVGTWNAGANPLAGGTGGLWMNHYPFGGSEYTLTANNELQYYASTSRVGWSPFSLQNNGAGPGLVMTVDTTPQASFRAGHTPSNPMNLAYNSGEISSAIEPNGSPVSGLYDFQYGYFETQMLLPGGPGMWVGVVLYPLSGPGELDIIETGGTDTKDVFSSIHCTTCNTPSKVVPVSDYTQNRHIYGVDWQPNSITWYVDRVATQTITTPTDFIGKRYYIAINLAIQGNPNLGFDGVPTSATVFPANMLVDWVKVWPNFAASQSIAPSSATWRFLHPTMTAANSNTVAVRDSANTSIVGSSNAFAVLLPESANNTVVTTQGPQIVDATGETFALGTGGQILVNGSADPTATGAVALAYVSHTVWFKNTAGNWYSKSISTASWAGPTTASPLPPETLTVTAIGGQNAGVAFNVAGTVSAALVPPTLQYSVSGGPWVAFPSGSSISTSAFTLTVPGISTAGAATVAVRDAGTPSITATSNSFQVAAAPVEQLSIATIGNQQQNVAFRVTGTIANAASIPTLQYQVNGGSWLALPSGSPASLVTQTSFAFTVPGISATGSTTVAVRDATTTTITATSNSFQNIAAPVESLTIGLVADVQQNTAFGITGTIVNATLAPTLQYSISGGTWLSLPSGAVVGQTSFAFTVPGISSVGSATVSVRDANATTITATSNSFKVGAVAGEALSLQTIANQAPNIAFPVAGSITGAAVIPTLQYSISGGSWLSLPSGSSVTLTGFSFTVPGISSTGPASVAVRDANATTITATSNSFQVIATLSETLTIQSIASQLTQVPFTVSGVIGNATSPPVLQYAISGGAYQALPAGSTVTATNYSFTVPGLAVGSATISVRDAATPLVLVTSNSFQVSAAGTEALTMAPIAIQPVGIPFSISGTIANVTSAPNLQYSDNGGAFQPFPPGSSIGSTSYSFIHPGLPAAQAMTVVVRDAAHPAITASSPAFPVIARESPNLTTITTQGPQITDSHGNAFSLTQGKQVAVNGVSDPTTSQVIEIAYVNRTIWYENANLQWWALNQPNIWGPTGGTILGPLPSSKANIYLTSTARLAVVTGFSVAVPGIVVNDTIVGGPFALDITSTGGTLTMPGASGTGTNHLTESGTLAAINASLAGLQYLGKTIGTGTVSVHVTDPAASSAAANVNIAVVRPAAVIPSGR